MKPSVTGPGERDNLLVPPSVNSGEEREEDDHDEFEYNGHDRELGELELDGDYSKHMEDIFSDDEERERNVRVRAQAGLSDEDEDEDMFVYDGRDAEDVGGYKERLHDVLGEDVDTDGEQDEKDNESEELRMVENSLMQDESVNWSLVCNKVFERR